MSGKPIVRFELFGEVGDEFKTWDALIGVHVEGEVFWMSEESFGVREGCVLAGYHYSGHGDNRHLEAGPFATFEEVCAAFEKALLGGEK